MELFCLSCLGVFDGIVVLEFWFYFCMVGVCAFGWVNKSDKLLYLADGHNLHNILRVDDKKLKKLLPKPMSFRIPKIIIQFIKILTTNLYFLLTQHLHLNNLKFMWKYHKINQHNLIKTFKRNTKIMI